MPLTFTEVEKYAVGKNIDKKIIGKKASSEMNGLKEEQNRQLKILMILPPVVLPIC